MHGWMEENQAVRMRCSGLRGGWVGGRDEKAHASGWVGGWVGGWEDVPCDFVERGVKDLKAFAHHPEPLGHATEESGAQAQGRALVNHA